jgi:hypothetical protein
VYLSKLPIFYFKAGMSDFAQKKSAFKMSTNSAGMQEEKFGFCC